MGMPEAKQRDIFHRFAQADSSPLGSTAVPGSASLSCRELALLVGGGGIEVGGCVGRGTFRVTPALARAL